METTITKPILTENSVGLKKYQEFEYTGRAMGTEYSVSVVCDSSALAAEMFEIAKKEIQEYEARFSRFLPTSELSILNEKKSMVVSETFLTALQKAYELFVDTKGIFNPLVQISRFGYNKSFNDPDFDKTGQTQKSLAQNNDEPYDIDFSSVVINPATSYVHLKPGQRLDFGGFLKGYLAEIIAKKIKSHSPRIVGVIVNLGGDIHTQGFDENGNKFIFDIFNPVSENKNVYIALQNQSLATSGTYKRSWLRSGEKIHHVLDVTGKKNSGSDIVSASIIHENGAQAEAYAKVFLTMSPKQAMKFLRNNSILFVVVRSDGEVTKNVVQA